MKSFNPRPAFTVEQRVLFNGEATPVMASKKKSPSKSEPLPARVNMQTETIFNNALELHRKGLIAEAHTLYEKVLSIQPDHFDSLHLLGVAAYQTGSHQNAVDLINKAIQIYPDNPAFYSNLSNALKELNQFELAVAACNTALSLNPEYADAYNNRGVALKGLKRLEEALESYDKAIALKPDYADAHSNRGIALQELKQLDEALISLNRAIAIKPDYAEAYSNRGNVLKILGQLDAALASYNQAISIKPDYAEAYSNKSLLLLLTGKFDTGWEQYEWRWKYDKSGLKSRNFAQPLWLGAESLEGKTILLHSEQGLGDTIQFCRYTRMVADLGARVILEVPETLKRLLTDMDGVAEVIVTGSELPQFDYYSPLLSLPHAFKTVLSTIPSCPAYLSSDDAKITTWSARLGVKTKMRVGIVWSGSIIHANDNNRSLLLSELAPYLPEECEYVSLQKELRDSDRATLAAQSIRHFGDDLTDFSDTAALCDLMDLIISVDTSVAHLAGALGKRTWVLLPYSPDWRWLLERSDSPWYPSMQLFRQEVIGDWALPLETIASALNALINKNITRLHQKTAHNRLIEALTCQQKGQLAHAREICEEILNSQPDNFEALQLLAILASQNSNNQLALSLINKAIAINPGNATLFFNRGIILKELKQRKDAVASYDQAIAIKPDYADAFYNRGILLQELNQLDAALASYDQAIVINPHYADAYYNRGNVLNMLNQQAAAITCYDLAIAIKPDHAEAYANRGATLQKLNQFDSALADYNRAIDIKPCYAEAYYNRGIALKELNQLVDSIASYDQAIAIKPDYAEAYLNKSLALLLNGDNAIGWELYEWRWKNDVSGLKPRDVAQPLWLGTESLEHKTILLHSEQGLGDTIQFCRYAKMVAAQGARVILEAPESLVKLLTGLEGVAEIIIKGAALPPFDYHCPLLSLPLAFKTTLTTIPSIPAYLRSDTTKVAAWSARLGNKTKTRVGIVWSGSTDHKNDHNRSMQLSKLTPYLPDGLEYVSLQKEVRDSDWTTLLTHPSIRHFTEEIVDFTDTAALCDLMDLVISVDTSVAHLSGALGKTTWVLLPCSPDWRWLLERSDSPWYPSITLHRQATRGNWTGVLENITLDLIKVRVQFENIPVSTQEINTSRVELLSMLQKAILFHQSGELAQAEELYKEIIAREPRQSDAFHFLGVIAGQKNDHQRALDLFNKAIEVDPDNAAFHANRANALKKLGHLELAVAGFDQAIALRSDFTEAYFIRGNILLDLRQLESALASYNHVIDLRPEYAEAYSNRGFAQLRLGQLEAALADYDRAIKLKPNLADAHFNRGAALQKLKRLDAAIESYDRAISINPDFAVFYSNRGSALKEVLRLDEAVANYNKAITIKPDIADAYKNKSLTLLLAEHYDEGWKLYEWRWKTGEVIPRNFSQPLWLGAESLENKTILLHSEQGLGDTIQFCRYTRKVAEKGARVILEVPESLVGLLTDLEGVTTIITQGANLPYFDYHCPLLSLPLAFKTNIHTIPNNSSYLHRDAAKVKAWSARLGTMTKPRVGIVWSGSTDHKNDHNRSLLLSELIPYLPDGLEYVCLQREIRDGDRTTLQAHPAIRHFTEELVDFTDTAALCDLMDLVISVDTSVAHLSGALGKTTWVLLPYCPDWRWLLERSDSPWYPSMQLFRQKVIGKWTTPLETIMTLLKTSINNSQPRLYQKTTQDRLIEAIVYQQKGQLAPAREICEEILEKQSDNFEALQLLAILASQNSNNQLALSLINKAIAINQGIATLYYNRGIIFKELGQREDSVASYDQAIAIKPDYAEAYYNRGILLLELNQLDAAVASYDQAIIINPNYADAYFNRGNALNLLNKQASAVASYDQAIAIKPDHAEAYANRGIAFIRLKQYSMAVESFGRASALKPDYVEVYSNRGIALQKLDKPDLAVDDYNRAIALKPEFAAAYYNCGSALMELGQLEKAIASYDRAIALEPNYAEAYSNRGIVHSKLKQAHNALDDYDQAIAIKPDYAEAYANRGVALQELKQLEAALVSFDKAIAIKPDYAEAYANRGVALQSINDLEAALKNYSQAIAINPSYADAYYNRGNVLKDLKQLNDAVKNYDQAITINPDYSKARWNKALALLLLGDYGRGWELYEWRWINNKCETTQRNFTQPLWLGAESLENKTILLHSEQGFGDTIQFCRYARMVAAKGARVLMTVPISLVTLLSDLDGVAEIFTEGATLPHFDYHCPLLSLPLAFKTTLNTIPASPAYLHSDADKVATWSDRLGIKTKMRVGIVWSGSTVHKNDHNRSLLLSDLMPYLPDGLEYVSLQKEVRDCDQATLKEHPAIRRFEEELVDFTDTAALCDLMDVIISVDTSVAHLSGALGKSTWVILPYTPDWRWLLDRSDSPWYPSMQLFRQDAIDEWESVLKKIKSELLILTLTSSTDKENSADQALMHFNHGNIKAELMQLEAAVFNYNCAINIKPDYAEAYSNRGVAQQQMKQLDEAADSYNKAISLKPDYTIAYFNLGNVQAELLQLEAAITSFDRAISIKPDYAEAYSNRGVALQELKRLDEAITSFDNAITLKSNYAEAYCNRGLSLFKLMRLDDAIVNFDRAIALKPDYAEAHWNKSLALLLRANYDQGWKSYEWRWKVPKCGPKPRKFAEPLWSEAHSVKNKTILIYSEQGLGDTIQFCRYVKMVAAQGARVLMEVPTSLTGLLTGLAGVTEIITKGATLPHFDYHCPLLSLPLAFETNLHTIPAEPAYLSSDAAKIAAWSAKLGTKTKARVGIVWSGSISHTNDFNRSILLSDLIPYLPYGLEYVSLQKEVRDGDHATLKEHPAIRRFEAELIDFTDTAALCDLMDLVISVDTSVAHLSGALGKNTWVLLPYIPDWRWLLDRNDSPWYPSMQLFRQEAIGDWESVLKKVESELLRLTTTSSTNKESA